MRIQIKHRYTNAVLFEAEVGDANPRPMTTAIKAAIATDANLAGAYLADANLAGADLAGANLARAYLAGADLARANLAGAYLAGANLAGAYLAGAYLADAYLAGAYLAGAYLADAKNVPSGIEAKDPPDPYVRPAASGAEARTRRMLRYREMHPDVPVVDQLDAKILDVVESGKGVLDMSQWHTCVTTHCRAGWAIQLAGAAGRDLERRLGDPQRAGTMIYLASTGRVPHFFATDERAMEDIRLCAAEQTTPAPSPSSAEEV